MRAPACCFLARGRLQRAAAGRALEFERANSLLANLWQRQAGSGGGEAPVTVSGDHVESRMASAFVRKLSETVRLCAQKVATKVVLFHA